MRKRICARIRSPFPVDPGDSVGTRRGGPSAALVRRRFRCSKLRHAWAAVLTFGAAVPRIAEARLVVGQIVVHGNAKTVPRVLAARMNLNPGDSVDFETLRNAEQRLAESGLFTQARVWIDLSRSDAARRMYLEFDETPIDVQVEVVEKQSWFVVPIASLGSGDYAGGVAYADQNFAGRDVQLGAAAQVGQSRSFIFAGYRNPLVVGAPLTWEATGLVRYEQIRFFVDHRQVMQVPTFVGGAEAQIGWVLSPHLRALLGFSMRYQRVHPAEVQLPESSLPTYNPRGGRIFRWIFQVLYDNTVAPSGLNHGVRLLIKNEASDQFWGSQFDYSKFESRMEFYGRFDWNYPSLILKSVFDFPTSSHGVPITEMLRIGGANLRGYLVNEFHGDTLASAQVEDQAILLRNLRVPFSGTRFNIAAAVFIDAATLLERHPSGTTVDLPVEPRPKLRDVHTSVGAGFRGILPGVAIPAIKVDVGYGIDVRSFALTLSIAGGT